MRISEYNVPWCRKAGTPTLIEGGMHLYHREAWIFVFTLSLLLGAPLRAADTKTVEARHQQLKQLLAAEWEYELRESPQFATTIGDYRYNDRWDDVSLSCVQRQKKDFQGWLSRFEAADTTGLPEQEKLNQTLMIRSLKERIEDIELKNYEMPVNQFNGLHLEFARIVDVAPFDSTKHYEDYIARLHQVPRIFEDLIEVLKAGRKDHLMPPRVLLEKTVTQCNSIAEAKGDENAFGKPVAHFPDAVPPADRPRLRDAILAAVDNEVRPAYLKLSNFIATDYAPKGRTEPGVWALPDGAARYRFAIRQMTTTNMDPEAIHQLGLNEVARIESEQLNIAKKLGFPDLKSFRASLKNNPKLIPTSREQILDIYRHYIRQMETQLPKLFGILPKTPVQVRSVAEFQEKEASTHYVQGTPDGARPGVVYVVTGDYQHSSLVSVESTAYHEGVPGHHLQISIAQTLPDLPAFRQQAYYGAYTEGWALYAEGLGKEIGFYQDPYSDYGRLSGEIGRAVRLVVDTGVHYKHWTRQQIVDYFHEHTLAGEPAVQAQTDRYIAWPAQALTYKLGELDILRLRQRAETELGSQYSIRAFHDEILNGGALPLDVLDARVTSWIADQKAAHSH